MGENFLFFRKTSIYTIFYGFANCILISYNHKNYQLCNSVKTVVCLCRYLFLSLMFLLFCQLGKCIMERIDKEYVEGFRTNGSESSMWHFPCPNECGRIYKYKTSMVKHFKHECGKEPKYCCTFCPKKFHQKGNLKTHIGLVHKQFF